MSLFRKSQPVLTTDPPPAPQLVAPTPESNRLFEGPRVDISAIYNHSKLSADELDRVERAEVLLGHLPKKTLRTREVVEATFRAFGVDQLKILEAAHKQLQALEAFIRFSHDEMQKVLDSNAKRIAELEAEIDRCREAGAKATNEGEERARTVNNELLKVQSVIGFFCEDVSLADLDDPTVLVPDVDEDTVGAKSNPRPSPPPNAGAVKSLGSQRAADEKTSAK